MELTSVEAVVFLTNSELATIKELSSLRQYLVTDNDLTVSQHQLLHLCTLYFQKKQSAKSDFRQKTEPIYVSCNQAVYSNAEIPYLYHQALSNSLSTLEYRECYLLVLDYLVNLGEKPHASKARLPRSIFKKIFRRKQPV